jgi:hypothetical protein
MKNEDDVRTLLRDVARTYEAAPPPTRLMVGLGRRAKTRRLALLAAGTTAAVVAVAVLGGAVVHAGDRRGTLGPAQGTNNDSPAGGTTRMPSVLGLSKQKAIETLNGLDGKFGVGIADDLETTTCDKVGTIIGQEPAAGERLSASEIGNLTITFGKSAQPYACDVDVPLGDRRIAQAFAAFADDMGRNHFPPADAPFAPQVALGIGNEYRKTITANEVTDPDQWRLTVDGYATAHGSLSAPDEVDAVLDYTELTTDMSPSSCTVTLADAPPLALTGGGHPIRIRNTAARSCWEDRFVDLYVNDAGQIVGVNLTLGVPEDMQKPK